MIGCRLWVLQSNNALLRSLQKGQVAQLLHFTCGCRFNLTEKQHGSNDFPLPLWSPFINALKEWIWDRSVWLLLSAADILFTACGALIWKGADSCEHRPFMSSLALNSPGPGLWPVEGQFSQESEIFYDCKLLDSTAAFFFLFFLYAPQFSEVWVETVLCRRNKVIILVSSKRFLHKIVSLRASWTEKNNCSHSLWKGG